MTDFKKKVQNEIAWVKVPKGENIPGWVKVTVGTEDNLNLDDIITKLKNVVLQRNENWTSWMLD